MMILYEDAYLIVCEKEPGVLSAPNGNGEGKDMLSLLAALFAARGESTVPYPVHRLDRPTGGLMVFAKDQKSAAALSAAAAGEGMKKEYLAVLEGVPDKAQGELCDLLFFDRQRDKSYVVQRQRTGVKEARLTYEVLATRLPDEACPIPLSLVRVRLLTGRTHQIRAQFAARRLPLYGDTRYGATTRGRMGLLAATLTFPHPKDGQTMRFALPMPKESPFLLFED